MTTLLRSALFLVAIVWTEVAAAQTAADGMAAMHLENWDQAISIYATLSKANPTDQNLLLTLGNAYLAKGDKAMAKKTFEDAFNAKPEGSLAWVANGRVLLMQDNETEADVQFKKAAKNGKKDVNALRQIGESYLFYIPPGSKKPNLSRAEELLKAAMDVSSKDYNTLMALGYCYKEMPNGGLAAQHYEFAEQQEPKNPLPKLMMAKVYKFAKLPEKFLEYVNKAIAVSPKYTPALREKAITLYFMRKWEDATQACKDLVTNGAEVSIDDEMLLANCLFITKDYKGCSELVEKIIQKDGSKTYLRRLLGYCLFETGEYPKGLTVMNEYFNVVTPEKVLASDYEYRGKLLIKTKGDTLMAVKDYRKAMEMDSNRWELHLDASNLLYSRKQYCESANEMKMYLDSVPTPKPTDLYNYGVRQFYCKEDSLRYQHALVTFTKVTDLMPKASIGWNWRAKCERTMDPSRDAINQNAELANEYGKARASYEQYVSLVAAADREKNKKDLISAYGYLTYCYFVKNEADKFNEAAAKWLELEPDNQNIKEMMNSFGKETPATPGTPGTPVPPGSNGKNK